MYPPAMIRYQLLNIEIDYAPSLAPASLLHRILDMLFCALFSIGHALIERNLTITRVPRHTNIKHQPLNTFRDACTG
jgi:hypothetical protein